MQRTTITWMIAALALTAAACEDKREPRAGAVTTTGAVGEPDIKTAMEASIETQLREAGFGAVRIDVEEGVVRVAGAVPPGRHEEALGIIRANATPFVIHDETVPAAK